MAIIKHKRSSVAGNKPTDSDLVLGELAINTHDGVIFFEQNRDGEVTIKEIDGTSAATNVFYVSKNGDDTNDGTSLARSFKTIDRALEVASVRRGNASLDSDGAVGSELENKTRRDLDFYVSASKYDIALGSIFNQVFQGRAGSYTQGITEVLTALDKTKDLVNDLAAINGNGTVLTRADGYWDEVKDIIQNGRDNSDTLNAAAYPIPSAGYYDTSATANDAQYSRELLLNNKVFISEEVNEKIKDIYPALNYDQDKCKRDIRFAVEALIYDATYLGNSGTYDNAAFFFFYGDGDPQISEIETPATAYAYEYMASIVTDILSGTTVVLSGQPGDYTALQQTAANYPSTTKRSELQGLVERIGDTIKNGYSYLTTNFTRLTPDADSRVNFSAGTLGAPEKTAFDAIVSNKSTIIDNVVTHIDQTYPLLFDIGDRYQDVLDGPEIASTIYVKTGEYTINNPLIIPKNVSLIGDNLKNTSIRPKNPTSDMFYVYNNAYVSDFTFRDHLQPAAVFAWNPADSAGNNIIVNSPYIRNCTSITGPNLSRNDDGTYEYADSNGDVLQGGDGIRNDGNHAGGIRSMVVDSFTQINQGGKGIYLKNQGYCQLVSVFTVYCSHGFLAENGGFASITNSNSSFGNIGLMATGVSPTLYAANVDGQQNILNNDITLKNLLQKPNISDAVKFSEDTNYFTVDSVSYNEGTGTASIKLLEAPTIAFTDSSSVSFHRRSALSSSGHTFEWIGTGTDVRTSFPYRGGVPVQSDEVIQDSDRGGLCFVTSTDQKGDFRVGENFRIQRSTGTIEGDAFDRSLFARITPFSLALED
jgi:hypothetical protein